MWYLFKIKISLGLTQVSPPLIFWFLVISRPQSILAHLSPYLNPDHTWIHISDSLGEGSRKIYISTSTLGDSHANQGSRFISRTLWFTFHYSVGSPRNCWKVSVPSIDRSHYRKVYLGANYIPVLFHSYVKGSFIGLRESK